MKEHGIKLNGDENTEKGNKLELSLIPQNRKGDIPTTLLVIGVVALCGLAIFIFVNSLNTTKGSFDYVEEIGKANMKIEEESLEKYHKEINDSYINFQKFTRENRVVFSVDYSSP